MVVFTSLEAGYGRLPSSAILDKFKAIDLKVRGETEYAQRSCAENRPIKNPHLVEVELKFKIIIETSPVSRSQADLTKYRKTSM
jgi:hypothetical protein